MLGGYAHVQSSHLLRARGSILEQDNVLVGDIHTRTKQHNLKLLAGLPYNQQR